MRAQPILKVPSISETEPGFPLWIMLLVTGLFLPIVLTYTTWVYRVLHGRVTVAHVDANPDSTY